MIPGSGRSAGEEKGYPLQYLWASFVAQLVRNLPTIQEAWVQSLGWEHPLEKGKARIHPWGERSQTRLSDFHFQTHNTLY